MVNLRSIYSEIKRQCDFAAIARSRMGDAIHTMRLQHDTGKMWDFWEAAQSYVVAAGIVVDIIVSGRIPKHHRETIKGRLGIDDARLQLIKDVRNGFVHQGEDLAKILFREATPSVVDCKIVDSPHDPLTTGLRHFNAYHGTLQSRGKRFSLADMDAELARIGAAASAAIQSP